MRPLDHGGFHGDLNATYPVGKVDPASLELVKTTKEALDEAIAICKPGVLYRYVLSSFERRTHATAAWIHSLILWGPMCA
ncbi:hypothetical protein QFC22_003699 [Naganishia vaughanmartiniae]|uniref:Uncharacterized protein n=1 Tax=Naganishia vaughanmartiniae TaxID=1424756 RepID=A0ACC2X8V2_9TREE|nr:hypothetical protein QFC22_003699 [Naganishia vaughanmartiniae]